MSDIAGPYSSLKILHHPERIAQLRRGEQIVPTHLEMVLSDLCNHDCSWCLAGDTLIDTPVGPRRIDLLCVGDEVSTPLGGTGRVTECGSREVSEILEVVVDGKRLLVTGEHPILTQDGYISASEVRAGIDSAAVRVWVRKDNGEKQGVSEPVECVHSRSRSTTERLRQEEFREESQCRASGYGEHDTTSLRMRVRTTDETKPENQIIQSTDSRTSPAGKDRQEGVVISDSQRLSRATAMPVRLRRESERVSENSVGGLHSGARSFGEFGALRGDSRKIVSQNETQQPNAASGNCCEGECAVQGQANQPIQGGITKHCRCSAQENVVGQESNEGHRRPPQGNGEGVCAQGTVKERDALFQLVPEQVAGYRVDRERQVVDRTKESRLSSAEAKKDNRSHAVRDIQQQTAQAEHGELRHSGCATVYVQEMELPSGFQEGPSQCDSTVVGSCDEVLHGEFGALERCLVLRPIASVRRLLGQFRVYNLSVEPFESYIANGVVVHNCAYRWTGYTSNELFAKDVPLAQFGTNNPMRMMRREKAIEIIDDMAEMGIGALECTGGGEPTVHPDCVDIMKYALDKGLDVALVSNGELFRPGHIENLLRCKWVRFSLDAATPEVYAANRRIKGERMHRVTANIKALTEARKRYIADGNKCDLIIGIGFVLNKENWWEAAACARLAKSLGADNIRISAVFQPDDDSYFANFYEGALAQCKEARQLEGDGFRVFDNFGDRYQDLVDKNPTHPFCGYQQFTTYVGADESNFRCCLLAYSDRGTIGSLKNQRLKDLWSSDEKKKDFETFDATQCSRCMFGSKLKTILYAIDTNPQHANFV